MYSSTRRTWSTYRFERLARSIMRKERDTIPADTRRWSEESRRSVSVESTMSYRDIHYTCAHCRTDAVFTAAQQQRAFEIKKAHISQRRSLCEPCWKESNRIAKELAAHDERWAAAKDSLRTDV